MHQKQLPKGKKVDFHSHAIRVTLIELPYGCFLKFTMVSG